MKPNLEKLYDKTPAEALATLATGAFFRADPDELRRIVTATAVRVKVVVASVMQPTVEYGHHPNASL